MSTPGLWQAPNGQGNPDSRPLPPGFVTQFDPSNPPSGGVNWNALAPAGATPGDRGPGGGYGGPGPAYGQGGGYNMQQGYPPPQMQHKSSSNTGAIVAAGAAGVVGGALIANALSDDDDYQDGYQAGLEAAEEDN